LEKFGCDIELPKAFHIAFVRSVEAHAKIIALDSALAKRAEGVHSVLVASDLVFSHHARCQPTASMAYAKEFRSHGIRFSFYDSSL
jgi:CO/xanthine dehydrogenase Mo-binding subunit